MRAGWVRTYVCKWERESMFVCHRVCVCVEKSREKKKWQQRNIVGTKAEMVLLLHIFPCVRTNSNIWRLEKQRLNNAAALYSFCMCLCMLYSVCVCGFLSHICLLECSHSHLSYTRTNTPNYNLCLYKSYIYVLYQVSTSTFHSISTILISCMYFHSYVRLCHCHRWMPRWWVSECIVYIMGNNIPTTYTDTLIKQHISIVRVRSKMMLYDPHFLAIFLDDLAFPLAFCNSRAYMMCLCRPFLPFLLTKQNWA